MRRRSLHLLMTSLICCALAPAAAQTTIKLGYATTPTSHYGVGSNASAKKWKNAPAGAAGASNFRERRWAASAR